MAQAKIDQAFSEWLTTPIKPGTIRPRVAWGPDPIAPADPHSPGFWLLLPARKFQKAVRIWLHDRRFATATTRVPYRCRAPRETWEYPPGGIMGGAAYTRYSYTAAELYQAARTAAHIAREYRLVDTTGED